MKGVKLKKMCVSKNAFYHYKTKVIKYFFAIWFYHVVLLHYWWDYFHCGSFLSIKQLTFPNSDHSSYTELWKSAVDHSSNIFSDFPKHSTFNQTKT